MPEHAGGTLLLLVVVVYQCGTTNTRARELIVRRVSIDTHNIIQPAAMHLCASDCSYSVCVNAYFMCVLHDVQLPTEQNATQQISCPVHGRQTNLTACN